MVIRYEMPSNWITYDPQALLNSLTDAKAAVLSLTTIPYQRRWLDALQDLQLKREVAGTSRIEGAEFTERELDAALRETPEQLFTRSQRQAHAAVQTYRWIARLEDDRPITQELICEVHRRIVSGADDDHCEPGKIRSMDENVSFGAPVHRGAEGGKPCAEAFARLGEALQREFRGHDPLIQALALHYHFASVHPFLDGNGRTARAVEALLLQRCGLRDTLFIAMSNYYYDEKSEYLATLSATRAAGHDLTRFLLFGLRGITSQCKRLFAEIRFHVSKELFKTFMYDLFDRLKTPRRRVIAKRQVKTLSLLLEAGDQKWSDLIRKSEPIYLGLTAPVKALVRDINELGHLGAVRVTKLENQHDYLISLDLEWPSRMSETALFSKLRTLPKSKTTFL